MVKITEGITKKGGSGVRPPVPKPMPPPAQEQQPGPKPDSESSKGDAGALNVTEV